MLTTLVLALATAAQQTAQPSITVIQAPDAPVRLENVRLLNAGATPLVLLYEAVNTTSEAIDQFTVMVFTFDKEGVLRARQVAPGRRTLAPNERKYSAMVLDGFAAQADHQIVAGVDQAQRVGSDAWWRADLRPLAEGAIKGRTR
jgi:hypothetical protein